MGEGSVVESMAGAGGGAALWEMGVDEFDRLTGSLANLGNVVTVLFTALEAEGAAGELSGTAFHVGEMARELLQWCREAASRSDASGVA